MKIEYPTQEEIDIAVSSIIEKGCSQKENTFLFIWNLYRKIGFRDIMHGTEKIMVILMAVWVFMIDFLTDYGKRKDFTSMCMLTIVISPFLFQLLLALFMTGEKEQGVYEIEMSCPYTMYHLLTLRMGIAGVFSAVMNGILYAGYGFSRVNGFSTVLRLSFLSVSSLLVYFVLYLGLLTKYMSLVGQVLLYLFWILGTGLIRFICPRVFFYITVQLPMALHILIWSVAFLLIIKMLSGFMRCNCKYNTNTGGIIC